MAKKSKKRSRKGCHCPRGSKPNGNRGCYKVVRKGKHKGARSVAKVGSGCKKRRR